MRITKLHFLLLMIAILVGGFYVYQVQQEKERRAAQAAIEAARQSEQRRVEAEKRLKEELDKKKELAIQAVAVAGEYWLLAKKEGRDVAQGQATLHQAKEILGQEDFPKALELARQSITELKSAPLVSKKVSKKLYYKVRKGDSLWTIARMPRHYGRGAMWTKIWRANESKISDFDLIYPRQVLLIPKNKNAKT
jgi:nucleoid-associated protein YgaU